MANKKTTTSNAKKKFTFKCKPCYNYQSIEFEFSCNDPENELEPMFDLYSFILEELRNCDIGQPDAKVKKIVIKPKEEKVVMPSARQKELMDYYGIPYDELTTGEEARKLIADSVAKSKNGL